MTLRILLKPFKPIPLISLVMTYLLGAGLVQYVREMGSWAVFFQGMFFLILFSLSLDYLRLLQWLSDPQNWPNGWTLRDAKQARLLMAIISSTFLTVCTTIMISWIQASVLWEGLVVLMITYAGVGVFYYLSQVIDIYKSFELLIEVLLFVVIPPAMAFFLQSTDPHPLLTLVVIGLVPGYLANRLLSLLIRFGRDQRLGNQTIVTQIGWENSMVYHNALILLTYLIYALITLLGFPWFLIWPVFLTLPIALLEIWLMERVRRGMKPFWRVMVIASACVLFIPIYLIGFAVWIR